MEKVSIIIPARDEPYLQKTVDDVFIKSYGPIEIIAILDGGNDQLKQRSNLKIIHHDHPMGTRKCLNEAIGLATGKYIFKLDAHCTLSKKFDIILVKDHQPDWVVTLPRYSFDPEKWELGHGPICYEYIAWPLDRLPKIGGLTPKKLKGPKNRNFYWMERKRAHIKIDNIQTCNAACWFLTKDKYWSMGGLNEKLWSFHIDGVEIGFKAWLSGGALKINKNAYHGHYFKRNEKRTVPLNRDAMRNTQHHSTWYWTQDKWPKATREFKWFVKKFWPIPNWPDNWEEQLAQIPTPVLREFKP